MRGPAGDSSGTTPTRGHPNVYQSNTALSPASPGSGRGELRTDERHRNAGFWRQQRRWNDGSGGDIRHGRDVGSGGNDRHGRDDRSGGELQSSGDDGHGRDDGHRGDHRDGGDDGHRGNDGTGRDDRNGGDD